MNKSNFLSLITALFLSVFSVSSTAADIQSATCPNSGILGSGLVDKLCWDCVFPIVVLSVAMSDDAMPDKHATNTVCSCENANTGILDPGFVAGYRAMSRIIEVVRDPHCSPFLGGIRLEFDDSMMKGNPKRPKQKSDSHKIYLNANSWSFPVLYLIEVLLDKNCTGDASTINLIGLSSISPTWGNDELSFHMNPEAAMFANPEFMLIGIADGLALAAMPDTWGTNSSRDVLLSAIGSWSGSLYPLTGNISHSSSAPRESSLAVARSMALSHRIGQSRVTMGNENVCGGSIFPFMPKTQYKISQAYPQAQATAPCCNYLGETNLKWNEYRNMPGFEDYIYQIFRWTDCCVLYF